MFENLALAVAFENIEGMVELSIGALLTFGFIILAIKGLGCYMREKKSWS